MRANATGGDASSNDCNTYLVVPHLFFPWVSFPRSIPERVGGGYRVGQFLPQSFDHNRELGLHDKEYSTAGMENTRLCED